MVTGRFLAWWKKISEIGNSSPPILPPVYQWFTVFHIAHQSLRQRDSCYHDALPFSWLISLFQFSFALKKHALNRSVWNSTYTSIFFIERRPLLWSTNSKIACQRIRRRIEKDISSHFPNKAMGLDYIFYWYQTCEFNVDIGSHVNLTEIDYCLLPN